MQISIEWIKEFLEIPTVLNSYFENAKDVMSKVTLRTAEVEEFSEVNQILGQVRVVEIVEIKKHPQADNLNLVSFKGKGGNFKEGEIKEVVCGAPNVRVGLKVPYAPIGTKFPDGLLLTPKKIRGVVSEGMLCSAKELGLGENQSGLMDVEEVYRNLTQGDGNELIGKTISEILKVSTDTILTVDNKSLTHRPDLWGHYGFSREFACIYDVKLKNPFDDNWKNNWLKKINDETSKYLLQKNPLTPIEVELKGESAAIIYWGITIDNIKVGLTPQWIKNRLEKVGLRSINSMVDISNYVMLEMGIPTHIFDYEKIAQKKLTIEKVQSTGQMLKTLDGLERALDLDDTIIRDEIGPLVLAGIMGGQRAEVDENTTRIFIESANWKSTPIRKTSTRLGLRTDASARYEKTLDSNLFLTAILRIVELVQLLNPDAKIVGPIKGGFSSNLEGKFLPQDNFVIETSFETFRKRLGHNVENAEIKRIFETLGFKVNPVHGSESRISVKVPTFRSSKDIQGEADLVEEIGRMVGYDNITDITPMSEMKVTRLDEGKKIERLMADFLVQSCQCLEVMTYPLVGEKILKKTYFNGTNLILKNALSVDHDRMRPSLIPNFIDCASLNVKNFDEFRLFELGRIYQDSTNSNSNSNSNGKLEADPFSKEINQLGLMYYSRDKSVIMDLINDTDKLLGFLNCPYEILPDALGINPFFKDDWPGKHPTEIQLIKIKGTIQGVIFSFHPFLLKDFKINGNLSMMILNRDILSIIEKKSYKPLPKFPESIFDCTVVLETKKPVGDILEVLKKNKKLKINELKEFKIVDCFYPEGNSAEKFVTLRFIYQDQNNTLSGEFLKSMNDQVISILRDAGFPLKV